MANTQPVESVRCPRCGASLTDDTSDGLCVRCLLTGALTPPSEELEAASELESPATLLARREFAGYELLGEIARGGMGVVFRAREKKLNRLVALKVIAAGELASPRMVERFRTEAQAAAKLDHPNIVPIYEVGHHSGWHFFSMRLIEGPTLAGKVISNQCSVISKGDGSDGAPLITDCGSLITIAIKIARAVQHAHERGVLHRDLKPGNVLLDARGEPHLTDFGLAKVLEGSVEMTFSNAILGTPAYMAPEQAAGGTRDVTVAADIYGLGAILYEMIAGRPPFAAPNTHALLRMIAEEEPTPPSRGKVISETVISRSVKSGQARTTAPLVTDSLNTDHFSLDADLDAICLKCLEKEPALRYHTAGQLADDLERALAGEPIHAQPSTRTQLIRKWVRRHPAKSGLIATAALSLVIITAGSLAFSVRLDRARRSAEASELRTRHALVSQHLHENSRLNAAHDGLAGLRPLLEARRLAGEDAALRQGIDERISATVQFSPRLLRQWDAGGTPVALRFSSDGRRLIAALRKGGARAWDLASGESQPEPRYPDGAAFRSIISPDGSQVLQLFVGPPHARLWNVTNGTHHLLALDSSGGGNGAFSPDGRAIATGGSRVRLWSTATGEQLPIIITNNTPSMWSIFSPDGRQLVTGHPPDRATCWNLDTGERMNVELNVYPAVRTQFSADGRHYLISATGQVQVLQWPSCQIISAVPAGRLLLAISFSPDARQVVTAGFDDQARVWDARTGQPHRLPMTHESGTNQAVFSPDGALLATAGFDYQLRLVSARDHRPVAPALHHSAFLEAVAFSDNSRFLASGDADGVVRVWDLDGAARPLLVRGQALRRTTHTADGRWMILADTNGTLHVCDLPTGAPAGEAILLPRAPAQVSLDDTPRFIGAALREHGLHVWDFSTRRLLLEITGAAHPAARDVRGLVFKPDGSEFVTLSADGPLQRWRTSDGQPVGPAMDRRGADGVLHWSGDGRWISAGGNNSAQIWDAQTGAPAGPPILGAARETLADCGFDPTGRRLGLVFGNDSIEPSFARLYELPGLRPVAGTMRHGDGIASAAFSADGKLFATGGEDNVARVWRAEDGAPVTGELRHQSIVSSLVFRQDGRVLASGSVDGTLRLWDVERGELLAPPLQLGGSVRPHVFTANGRALFASVGGEREVVWKIDLPAARQPDDQLPSLAGTQSGFKTNAAGLTPWPSDATRWHEQNAVAAETRGHWFTAKFHLERLAPASPDDVKIQSRLQNARARTDSVR